MVISHWLSMLRKQIHFGWKRRMGHPARRESARKTAAAVEMLEDRCLLAATGPNIVAITPNVGGLLNINNPGANMRDEAFTEVQFRFNEGQSIDPNTLGGIEVVRSGFDGVFGNGNDVFVTPGFVGVGDRINEVVMRFAATLPDDNYQFRFRGTGLTPLQNQMGVAFGDGTDQTVAFELDRGALVEAVVPTPVLRDKILSFFDPNAGGFGVLDGDTFSLQANNSIITFEYNTDGMPTQGLVSININPGDDNDQIAAATAAAINGQAGPFLYVVATHNVGQGSVTIQGAAFSPRVTNVNRANFGFIVADGGLVQRNNLVNVFFNQNDLLNAASAQNPAFYNLVNSDTGRILQPTSAAYNINTNTVTLDFGAPLPDGTFNLRIGESVEGNDSNGSATDLGTQFAVTNFETEAFLGDAAAGAAQNPNDVDVYEIELQNAANLSVTATPVAGLDLQIEVFDGTNTSQGAVNANGVGGQEVLNLAGLAAGTYFIHITGDGATTGSYHLDIDSNDPSLNVINDMNSSFATATNIGVLGGSGQTINSTISPQVLGPMLPLEPGSNDEPGHKQIPVAGENHIAAEGTPRVTPGAIPTITYNFPTIYGFDPQGNPFFNAITANQRERTREIFELYAYYTGIEFVELTDDQFGAIQVITGDLRAISPLIPTGPGGASGLADGTRAIMDAGENFGESEYGGFWFRVAMHEIGHNLNLDHSGDLPSIMNGGTSPAFNPADSKTLPESAFGIFPGDHDITHIRRVFPRHSTDIDLYQFTLDQDGNFSAETIAERRDLFNPGQATSQLNTALILYQDIGGVRTIIAQNDDFFGHDSYINLDLTAGTYFLGVSSTGNTNYDPDVEFSGSGGLTDGPYELNLSFTAPPPTQLVDNDNGNQTAIDGDADGQPGGVFNSWFQTGHTIFVDRTNDTDGIGDTDGDGSLANPFEDIDQATADAANTIVAPSGGAAAITDGETFVISDPFNNPVIFEFDVGGGGVAANHQAVVINGGDDAADVADAIANAINTSIAPLNVAANSSGALIRLNNAETVDLSGSPALMNTPKIIRVVGNGGTDGLLNTIGDNTAYEIGVQTNQQGLRDGKLIEVPQATTMMVDAGAVLKFRDAIVDVGTAQQGVDRSQAAFQVLGTTLNDVFFTSWHNDNIGGNTDGQGPVLSPGDWGGIVYRGDSDRPNAMNEERPAFLNIVNHANMSFGGGPVSVGSISGEVDPIHLIDSRPTISFNTIQFSANAAVSANPDSFNDANMRFGPDVHGNTVRNNTLNGLFVRTETALGQSVERLNVTGVMDDRDITHIVTENLIINGTPGGAFQSDPDGPGPQPLLTRSRPAGRLWIAPGLIVKLSGSRIEAERGGAQLIAEGIFDEEANTERKIIFTSIFDDRFGAGGTFDTTNDGAASTPAPGDWGGIVFNATSRGNIDQVEVFYGGGVTPIEGDFAEFNPIEIHQADVRVTNSLFQFNASGIGPQGLDLTRNARGNNGSAVIFVRGAQPIVVANIFRDNAGNVINIDANSMKAIERPDRGRNTGIIDAFTDLADNRGPLVRLNRMIDNGANGMLVRGQLLTTETIWEDTDIVHIVSGEVLVPNHHTFSGLRLESTTNESLVVKFLAGAGLTASGFPLDINDRIGGTLQVIGKQGNPVVLTSIFDSTIGAGLQPDGTPLFATVSTGTPAAGDWRGIRIDEWSNDRNVAIVNENEPGAGQDDTNSIPPDAQFLGTLAPFEIASDENRRAGFEVEGTIKFEDSTDVDVYSFQAEAGTEIWLDLDDTTGSLDTVLELITAGNDVQARSIQSFDPSLGNPFQLITSQPGVNALPMQRDARLGGQAVNPNADGDFYTTNPKDAGMRVILPGTPGEVNTYFVRVRSNTAAGDINNLNGGLTAGNYQLQIRLQQEDEKAGTTVRGSDIRFAETAIEIVGGPKHSPIVGESGESEANGGNNNTTGNADPIGNVLETDGGVLGLSGVISGAGDVDFFQMTVEYKDTQQITGVNDQTRNAAMTFDIDYADGFARVNSSIFVFDSSGQLVLASTESNVSEDRQRPLLGGDFENLDAGSPGGNDPYIGSVELSEGTYFVAVVSNAQVPQVFNQLFTANATNALVRLEPIDSVKRIAEDHIDSQGGMTSQDPATLVQLFINTDEDTDRESTFVPWHLGDVTLFVSQDTGQNLTRVRTVDPFTGTLETTVGQFTFDTRDIRVRNDGNLISVSSFNGNDTDANNGGFLVIDSGNANVISNTDDGILTFVADANGNPVRPNNGAGNGITMNAIAFNVRAGSIPPPPNQQPIQSNVQGGTFVIGRRNDNFGNAAGLDILYQLNPNGTATSNPQNDRTGAAQLAGAATQIVERGILDTTIDAFPQGGGAGSVLVVQGNATNGGFFIDDGDTFAVDDGGTTIFELDAGPQVIVTLNPSAGLFARDGDTFTLDGNTFEFNTGEVIVVSAVNGFGIIDGETIQITDDQNNIVTFEFDRNNSLLNSNNFAIPYSTADNNAALVSRIVTAINGVAGFQTVAIAHPAGQGRITLTNENVVLNNTSQGITLQGDDVVVGGNAPIDVEETFDLAAFLNAITSTLDGSAGVFNHVAGAFDFGNGTGRLNFPTANVLTAFNFAQGNTIFANQGTAGGVGGGNIEVDFLAGDTAQDMAARIAAAINAQLGAGSASVNGSNVILTAPRTFNAANTDDPPFSIGGGAPGGVITGAVVLNNDLWVVSDNGGLYRVVNFFGGSFDARFTGAQLDYIDTAVALQGIDFQGLTVGPQNVENNAYRDMLFAIDGSGELYAFDTTGALQPVFLDGQTSIQTGAGGNIHGLAFSNLDQNQWNVNSSSNPNTINGMPGHGINPAFNNIRVTPIPGALGSSLQFASAATQAGGAHGSMETETFSLEGYSATDNPALYFNYFLETEGQSSAPGTGPMRDAFRVFIADESGEWDLLTTNNSFTPDELSFTPNDVANFEPFQVQETFDNTNTWRQARIDLSAWAGKSEVKLRFDFSTAASFNVGDLFTAGEELRLPDGMEIRDGDTFDVDNTTFEFDLGFTLVAPTGARIADGQTFILNGTTFEFDTANNGVGGGIEINLNPFGVAASSLSASEVADQIGVAIGNAGIGVIPFRDENRVNLIGGNALVNNTPTLLVDGAPGVNGTNEDVTIDASMTDIEVTDVVRQALADEFAGGVVQTIKVYQNVVRIIGHDATLPFGSALGLTEILPGDSLGAFNSNLRGQNNDIRGVFIDDIIIGFTERGEMVTNAGNNSSFTSNPNASQSDINVGAYQLEVRRGTENFYVSDFDPPIPAPTDTVADFVRDTNDRIGEQVTLIAPAGSEIQEGQIFQLSDGVNMVVFEFDDSAINNGVGQGNIEIPFSTTDSAHVIAERIRNTINAPTTQQLLAIVASLSDTNSPNDPFSTSNRVNLYNTDFLDGDPSDNLSGNRSDVSPVSDVDGLFAFGDINFEVFDELGDDNQTREQGRLIIEQNQISNTLNDAIRVDANSRNGELPSIGTPRSLPTLNVPRLAPGVVIDNNLIFEFGQTGVNFIGDTNTVGTPNAAVPFHRVTNNTIYGGVAVNGTGVNVGSDTSPTLINNIVANTNMGINNNGNNAVIGTTLFQGNGNNGAVGSNAINLASTDPLFANPLVGNFYLVDGSLAVDSSLNLLLDRPAVTNVGAPIGIPDSNILAPSDDVFFQERIDDPSQTPPPGLGSNIVRDRGAVERADFDGPTARISSPNDNGVNDQDPDLNELRILQNTLQQIEIQFADMGIGIDDAPAGSSGNYQISLNGVVLTEGTDYLFVYNSNLKKVTFQPATGQFQSGRYEIRVRNLNQSPLGIRDIAGNSLQPNQPDGTTLFVLNLGRPTVTIDDVVFIEDAAGINTTMAFTVSLSTDPGAPIVVNFATSDDASVPAINQATANVDYIPTAGQVTFNPGGALTQTINVTVLGDDVTEDDEQFLVNLNLQNPALATLGDGTGVGLIPQNDGPQVTITDGNVVEGDAGVVAATFNVTLDRNPVAPVTIGFATTDGTATAGQDYNAANGQLVFNPGGPLTQQVTVNVIGDTELEANETFTVDLALVGGIADIVDGTGVGTITDDDLPTVTVSDDMVTEEDGAVVAFTVTLSHAVNVPLNLMFATGNLSATAGPDYQATNGNIVIAPGQTSVTIEVPVVADGVMEGDETFVMNAMIQAFGRMSADFGIGTIKDPQANILPQPGDLLSSSQWAQWSASNFFRTVVVGDFNGDLRDDVAGFSNAGIWFIGRSTGSSFQTLFAAQWLPAGNWFDFVVGDFNGDGRDDVAGFRNDGVWQVGLSTGTGFTTVIFASGWSGAAAWREIFAADVTGDGFDDVVAFANNGTWWVGISGGAGFFANLFAQWSAQQFWANLEVADFNNDGRTDVAGFSIFGGWFVGIATANAFSTTMWAQWSAAGVWGDLGIGDFNGDGKVDVFGYGNNGAVFIGYSTGSAFSTIFAGQFQAFNQIHQVESADLNGDGLSDLVRFTKDGQWRGALSNGLTLNTDLALQNWTASPGWFALLIGDFNGDGKDDVAGFGITGAWFVGLSLL